MPKISTWLLYTIFTLLAVVLFAVRAAVFPDVPVSPTINALNFCAGVLMGHTIHRTYTNE